MTATTLPPPPAPPAPPAPPTPPARGGSRTAAIVAASVMSVLSLAAFAGGAVALWGDSQRDGDGYISTANHRFTAGTAALTTEEIDVDADLPSWAGGDDGLYGKMRMRVESRDGGPVFAGIARTSDVQGYLAGASHTVVTDIETDPFDAEYAAHEGARQPAAPGGEDIWVATAEGAGERTLDWDVREGRWSVVVMNPDGSRGVDADVSAGVRIAFLGPLGWGLLGGGALLLLGAAGVGYAGLRRR